MIHSFFVPAFRIKQDVDPGRYSTFGSRPRKPGKYHLSAPSTAAPTTPRMIGWVYAMEPQDYQAWLGGNSANGSLANNGKTLFAQLACDNCHKPDNSGRCPNLIGLFSQPVKLVGGTIVKADESYIRESILQPQAKIVAGYDPVMPTFQGLVTEDQVLQLVEYVKSLGPQKGGAAPTETSPKPAKGSRSRTPSLPITRAI